MSSWGDRIEMVGTWLDLGAQEVRARKRTLNRIRPAALMGTWQGTVAGKAWWALLRN
jgi:hypothetical protein